MFVEIVDYPARLIDLAVLVTSTAQKIVAGIYMRGHGQVDGALDAPAALPLLALGKPPDAITHHGELFIKQSVIVHDPDSMMGFDELVDFSVLDLYSDGLAWEPRLAQTRQTKIIYSARLRELQRRQLLASLYVRFCTADLSETVVHLVNCGQSLVTDLTADRRLDGSAVPIGPNGGARWLQYMWRADIEPVPTEGDVLGFGVKLRNADGSECEHSTRLFVEADAGYLPRRFVTTNSNGEAFFVMHPIGLAKGDPFKIKLNTTHFSGVGKVEGTV